MHASSIKHVKFLLVITKQLSEHSSNSSRIRAQIHSSVRGNIYTVPKTGFAAIFRDSLRDLESVYEDFRQRGRSFNAPTELSLSRWAVISHRHLTI
jgi:hypothetical protein